MRDINYHSIIAISIIVVVTIAFFFPLFYPTLKLYSTPDFGQSDIWMLNLPAKKFLSDSLKSGEWPLWNPYIGNGFPQLAEGQIATFNLSNLLLFRFFSLPIAYNLSYIVIFLTTAIGTYLFCRSLRLSLITSTTISLLFSFSGFFITHISHLNLLQTSSFLPLLFFTTHKFLTFKKIFLWGPVLSFILSQQIFSGFPQITLITLIGIFLYALYLRRNFFRLALFTLFIGTGLIASAVQLLPQKEFLDLSNRAGGLLPEITTLFSYPPKHLLTFIFPYALGDPRVGTYPHYSLIDGSIFWENTGYIGIVPLILVFSTFLKIGRNKYILFFFLLALISFLLMLGKYSPLYFIFPFPPLSYFRVPSRFIILFVFSLIVLTGFTLDRLKNTAKIIFTLIILANIFYFSFSFNPTLPAAEILKKPAIFSSLPEEFAKIYTFGLGNIWNEVFLTEGWQHPKKYLFFSNALSANQNVLYNIKSFQAYRAQTTRRYELIASLLDTMESSPSSIELNALKLYSVTHLISASSLKTPPYKIPHPRPEKYATSQIKYTPTLKSFYQALENLSPSDNFTIFVENNIDLGKGEKILVFNQSYYPGWKANVSGKPFDIFPVNVNQMGVIIKRNGGNVDFSYQPQTFSLGKKITITTYICLLILAASQTLKLRRI